MQDMKIIFESLCLYFSKRYSKKDKNKFLIWSQNYFKSKGLPAKIEIDSHYGSVLVTDNLTSARFLLVAGYETLSKSFFRGFKYYPFDRLKNRRQELSQIIVQILLVILLSTAMILLVVKLNSFSNWRKYLAIAAIILLGSLSYIISRGTGNKYNFSRQGNIAVVLKSLESLSHNVGVVLVDNTTLSYSGYKFIQRLVGADKDKEVIILDNICACKDIFIAAKNIDVPDSDEYIKLNNFNKEESPLALFEKAILIASGTCRNGEVFIENMRSKRDVNFDIGKLDVVCEFVTRFISGR